MRVLTISAALLAAATGILSQNASTGTFGDLANGAHFVSFEKNGHRGIAITGAGSASVQQSEPIQLEFYNAPDQIKGTTSGYQVLHSSGNRVEGTADVPGPGKSRFAFKDEWSLQGDVLELSRTVRVSGATAGGFLSSITLTHAEEHPRQAVEYFAPGMIYGSPAHLTDVAIGGAASYEAGALGQIRIREDRLPAPLVGVRFEDGTATAVLDPAPDGATVTEDSQDTAVRTLVNERFRFGAIGVDLDGGHHSVGYWFPGTEGEMTYRGNTYPGGQLHQWRRRYHPIRDGFTQTYRVQFRFSKSDSFSHYLRDCWRWAYAVLSPKVTWQDIPAARRSIVDTLAAQVQVRDGRAGIPNSISSVSEADRPPDDKAVMGFTGKNLESAEFLLADAQIDPDSQRAADHRKLALAVFASFLKLRMNPPVGEGFSISTGDPVLAIPRMHCVFLRSFGDDMKATLRAYRRERKNGTTHADWLAWTKGFGDWLLTQQTSEGAFPRSWKPVSGEVFDSSPQSTYNAVPFLVLLGQETGNVKYSHAAERAADFVWNHGQAKGQFVGGTIDNPDVLDKEAGTLSIEAYLALYYSTKDTKWLSRAQAAADYAETWIYLWNVPMPEDADDRLLHWKKGVATTGTQLIASGHSLVDDYMSFDVDEYAKLGRWAKDDHYLAVSKLLLHNTKNMVALPGRTFDLKGPGWQQEHFSFAPVRGFGLHRLWLPWVATSQLNGIFGLMEFDPSLFQEWTTVKGSN